jgi:hypothetical protein
VRHAVRPIQTQSVFGSASAHPYAEHGMRLSMLLPTDSVEQAKALIGRGVASGFSTPAASAYYLTTSEHARNSRATFFPVPA